MTFKKGYIPSEEHKRKLSETRKRLIKEGLIDMKKIMNSKVRKKISKTLLGHPVSKETRDKMRGPKSEEHKKKLSESHRGYIHPLNQKIKISQSMKKRWKDINSKLHSCERSEKLRTARLKQFEVHGKCQNIGKNEKEILDNLEVLFGHKIERQHFIRGYSLDGYIPPLNIAIEIDEKNHRSMRSLTHDEKKEKIIKKELNCLFIRIKDY